MLIGIGIVFAALAVKYTDYAHKRDTGYCFKEDRYLSDRELADVIVTRLLENLKVEFETLSIKDRENTIQYQDLDHFYSINTHCCRGLGYTPQNKTVMQRRLKNLHDTGLYKNYGNQIIGPLNYKHDKFGPKPYRKFSFRLSYCGNLYGGKKPSSGKPFSKLPANYYRKNN